MRVALAEQLGGIDSVELGEQPDPVPAAGQGPSDFNFGRVVSGFHRHHRPFAAFCPEGFHDHGLLPANNAVNNP